MYPSISSVWKRSHTLGLLTIAGIGVLLYAAYLVSMILTQSFTDTDLLLVEQFEARFDLDLS